VSVSKVLSAIVRDSSGAVNVTFYNYTKYHTSIIQKNHTVNLYGTVQGGKMIHPKIVPDTDIGAIKACYGRGVRAKKILSAIENVDSANDSVPEDILRQRGLPDIKETFRMLHFPQSYEEIELAKWRLAYTELYAALSDVVKSQDVEGISIPYDDSDIEQFMLSFPFDLTPGQVAAVYDILTDMKANYPMRRFLVGDVGTGKTEVATVAVYATVKAGYRVLYMCPTEMLTIQTYHRLAKALAGTAYVALYTSDEKVKKATPDVVVGTHALLYNNWQYHNIGLTVIDEQHKFGVSQRGKVLVYPECNLLEISATPIPRSYALFVQDVMNVSLLDDIPYHRNTHTEVIYGVHKTGYRRVIETVKEEIKRGNQAMIVYPSVESERCNMKPAKKAYEYWKNLFGEQATGLLYGGIEDKESILKNFKNGDIKVLVSTSAAEVGIDIPKLTVCVVVNAERFGLSQLHQIRGRVGRRGDRSYFFVITKNIHSIERLKYLERYTSGFDIADIDTVIRGIGTLNGNAQTGHFFKYFSFVRDVDVANAVKEDIKENMRRNKS
ncbi:MAG: DEAD/DEAH box helicase, partial [Thermodesulfovibrionales bacterium]